MGKYILVTRQKIIDANTRLPFDDEGLKALNGYREYGLFEIEETDNMHEVMHQIIENYKKEHPNFSDDQYCFKRID